MEMGAYIRDIHRSLALSGATVSSVVISPGFGVRGGDGRVGGVGRHEAGQAIAASAAMAVIELDLGRIRHCYGRLHGTTECTRRVIARSWNIITPREKALKK